MKRRPLWFRLLILLVIIQTALPLVMVLLKNKQLFFPRNSVDPESQLRAFDPDVTAQVVRIARPDGRELAAYDARPKTATDEGPVVLFFHGNGGDIAMRAGTMSWIVETTDARLVMPDYSGYGGNEGSASEKELYKDALASYDWLVAQGVDPSRIILYGESLGGAAVLYVASERKVAGVVLQSTFTSLSSMAWKLFWWMPLGGVLVAGEFPNAKRAEKLDVPVLVVHGTRDRIVPFSEGEALHQAIGERADNEFLPIELAGHNDVFYSGALEYLRELRKRFHRWVPAREEAK